MPTRRTFLRKLGLTIGAISFGPDPLGAFTYQKKTAPRTAPPEPPVVPIDFRYSPGVWRSPISFPGDAATSFVTEHGGLIREGRTAGMASSIPAAESVEIRFEGEGETSSPTQRIDSPGVPVVRTALGAGGGSVEMTAFSTRHEDEGAVDNFMISVTPGSGTLTLRLSVRSPRTLSVIAKEDDDFPRGAVCALAEDGDSDRAFLFLDAPATASTEDGALVLRSQVDPAGGTGPVTFTLRVPAEPAELDALSDGARELDERMKDSVKRWETRVPAATPAGWTLIAPYGDFLTASVRIVDQLRPAHSPAPTPGDENGVQPPAPSRLPDIVDEHFLMESEFYSGREKEARERLERIWNLENNEGRIVGAGGPANTKEMSAAVYALCRHAELSGDWKFFNELYPDAFNALNSMKEGRDQAAASGTPNGKRNLLAGGSLGRGWQGTWNEVTNTLWTLMALKQMLKISDRLFLAKKSEIREFYGQLRLAFVLTTREEMVEDPAGFRYLPMTLGGVAEGLRPQSAQASLAVAIAPGVLFAKEDPFVQGFQKLMESVSREGVPMGTGPGDADDYLPVDAALLGQVYLWASLPEEAHACFAGFLNHASTVYTWSTMQRAPGGALPPGGPGLDPRASAECIRALRHILVFEDEEVLRLLEGVSTADTGREAALEIRDTPTRWGRVSVALEPVDKRTWTLRYKRVPNDPRSSPPLTSVELPRVIPPNFRFDTITGTTAIKNGPRVIIDGSALAWEARLIDLMR